MESQAKLSRITISNILLATDFSPEAQNALQCAGSLAKRYGSTLFLTPCPSFGRLQPCDGRGMAGPCRRYAAKRKSKAWRHCKVEKTWKFLPHEADHTVW